MNNPDQVGYVLKQVDLIVYGSYDCGNGGPTANPFQSNGTQGCQLLIDPGDLLTAGGNCFTEYNQTYHYGYAQFAVSGW